MGLKFNPPPGWPVPYGFEPPAGWEPDPTWPAPPPDWPLWMGRDVPRSGFQAESRPTDLATYPAKPRGGRHATPAIQPPGYPVPASGYGYGQPPPGQPLAGTNGWAIACFVLGLLSVWLLSTIFGIIALVKISNRPQRGKGLAIAGLVITLAWFIAYGAIVAVALERAAPRSVSTGHVTGKGQVDIFSLRAGDCFQNPRRSQLTQGVSKVAAVPCTKPHNAQVFAQFPAAGGSYPGHTALVSEATKGCEARVSTRVVKSRITRTMRVEFFFPQPLSWLAGRRAIRCLIIDSKRDLRVSLLKASRVH